MLKKTFLLLFLLCISFSLFAQSPYGRILTLDNSGTQQWIDIIDVITNYFEYHSNSGFPAWLTSGNTLSGSEKLGSKNEFPLIFITNDLERMRITETGNVGIGKTNPAEKLDVAGNVRFSGALMPNGSAGTIGQLLMSQGASSPPVWSTVNFTEADPVFSNWIDASGSSNNQILRFNGNKYTPVSTGDLTTTTNGVAITGGSNAVIGNGVNIVIATASSTSNGLLSSSDWTTFNSKENVLTFNSPLSREGNTISIPQANNTTSGYLSSSDWTTFNSKENVLTFNSPLSREGNTISIPQANNTTSGYLSSSDWTSFNSKENVLTFSSPLSREGNTISIPQANNTTSGYLSSSDWTTFNSKENVLTFSSPLSREGNTISIPQADNTTSGYLSSSDWTSFNNRWSLSGNSLSGSEKLGSTNNQPVVMVTNGTDRFRFTTKGQIEVLNSGRNVFIGEGAGASQNILSTQQNVFVGYQAGYSNTTGYDNTACGVVALKSNTTGVQNTACGAWALYSNTTGERNTASGYQALYYNTTGYRNTASGFNALHYNTTGSYNTASGGGALFGNRTGNYNTASGSGALNSNTTGSYNTTSGAGALYSNTTGSNNTAIGFNALYDLNITDASDGNNTAIGYNTGRGITTGKNNTIVGANVTNLPTNLSNNIIIADGSGNRRINVDANGNVGIGTTSPSEKLDISGGNVGITNTDNTARELRLYEPSGSGTNYTAFKAQQQTGDITYTLPSSLTPTSTVNTGVLQTDGSGNLSWLNPSALVSSSGWSLSGNSLSGSEKLGSTNNNPVVIVTDGLDRFRFTRKGQIEVLNSAKSVFLGEGAGASQNNYLDDRNNVFVGYQAGYSNEDGNLNTASGAVALYSNTTGNFNTASGAVALFSNTYGYENTACGSWALYSNTTGNFNTAIGYQAGSTLTTGSNNILIGHNAQPSAVDVSNEVTIGNSSNNSYRMYADSWTNASDSRYKHDIADLPYGLDFILKLRPRQFIYNNSNDNKLSMGFIAQEVQEVMKQYDMQGKFNLVRIMEQDYLGLNTTQIIPILVKAVQELSAENEELKNGFEQLKKENEELKLRLERLEKVVQGGGQENTNLGSSK
jgi:hypothetical protein